MGVSMVEPGLEVLPSKVETDQGSQSHGTGSNIKSKKKLRGWLALGSFFLTIAIGYSLMFLAIDYWLKGSG